VVLFIYEYLKKRQLNTNGVQSNTVNVMERNDTETSFYRHNQTNITTHEDNDVNTFAMKAINDRASEVKEEILDLVNKRLERIESNIERMLRLKNYDE
jgi:hypothetical protein